MATLDALYSNFPRNVVAIAAGLDTPDIMPCLRALAAQQGRHVFEVVLLLDAAMDATAAQVREAAPKLSFALHVEQWAAGMPPAAARRLAMDLAAMRAGKRGIVLTTRADCRVGADWVAANLAAIEAGADAVAGQVATDADDALGLPREGAVLRLATMLDEITSRLDPDDADPWPRHPQNTGDSIALTAEMFRRAGGIPDMPFGETRAFLQALRRADARIRHCPHTRVTVSRQPETVFPDELESATATARRAILRRTVRAHWNGCSRTLTDVARSLALPEPSVCEALEAPTFGAAWQILEDHSPTLARRPTPVGSLDIEMRNATDVLYALNVRRDMRDSAVVARKRDLAHVV